LAEGRQIYEAERGIFSTLAADAPPGRYDARWLAPVYDNLIGSRLYNRLVWKADCREYARFERRALDSADGWMLDAGCGSLVFTADVIARGSERPIVLLDYSIQMLRRARRRLERVAGSVPENLILLQADLFDLPFRPGTLTTVSAPFVIHLFQDVASLVGSLDRVLAQGGGLFITSLVSRPGSRFSNWYLRRLHKAGEVAVPRDADQVQKLIEAACTAKFDHCQTGHVAYFWSSRLEHCERDMMRAIDRNDEAESRGR
jgi:ubiquinone/menaquinone biosynthesis C-methylase UbiE